MQTAVMEKLQQQMMSNIEKVSPEALMQSWFTFDPKIAERFSDMFVTMAGLGGSAPATRNPVTRNNDAG
jgi:tyrosyl-tRNA synthetase